MEIDIQVKGGVELSKFYPDEYEMFEEKVGALIMDTFPGVDGFFMGKELTDQHQKEENNRQNLRKERLTQELTEVLKEPEMQDLIRGRLTAIAGN